MIDAVSLYTRAFINPKRRGQFIEGTCPVCHGKIWAHIPTTTFNCRRTSCILSSGSQKHKGNAKLFMEIMNITDSFDITEPSNINKQEKYPKVSIAQKNEDITTHQHLIKSYFAERQADLLNTSYSFPSAYRELLLSYGFSFNTIKKFGFAAMLPTEEQREFPSLIIPYYDDKGNIIQFKFIRYFNKLKRKQSKEITKPKFIIINNTKIELNNKNLTYNAWNIKNDDSPILVVEGELKAELLTQWGYTAIALGGTDPPEDYKSLIAERNIIIMMDSDPAGRDATQKIIKQSKDALSIKTLDLFPDSVSKADPNDIIEFSKIHKENAQEQFKLIFKHKPVLFKEHHELQEGKILTLHEILEADTDNTQSWIIEGIIPNEGVSIVFAPPRIGKTFWLIDICYAITAGTEPMDAPLLKPKQTGRVLYISLEDTLASFKERAQHLKLSNPTANKLFHVATNWRPFQNDSGINDIQRFLNEHPDTKLVIIDTYVTVKSKQKDSSKASSYEFGTEELMKLRKICRTYKTAIILVWHTTKATMSLEIESINKDNFMQFAMDSTSLTASSDSAIMLFRQAQRNNEGKLLAKPKTGKVIELKVKYDESTCKWSIINEFSDLAKYADEQELTVLEVIYTMNEASQKEISKAVKLSDKQLILTLHSLREKNFIVKKLSGKYTIASEQLKNEIHKRIKNAIKPKKKDNPTEKIKNETHSTIHNPNSTIQNPNSEIDNEPF